MKNGKIFSTLLLILVLLLVLSGCDQSDDDDDKYKDPVLNNQLPWESRQFDSDSSLNDYGEAIARDSWGNLYIAGHSEGALEEGYINKGGDDLLSIKCDSGGNQQWVRQMGGKNGDLSKAVAVDTNGNVYVSGYTHNGLNGNTSNGGYDFFLIKYGNDGSEHWTSQGGTKRDEYLEALGIDRNGNIYIAGHTGGTMDDNVNKGLSDIFVVKYNSNGEKMWSRMLGTADNEIAKGIAVDGAGNVYITGATSGSLEEGYTNKGEYDIILIKYDTNGTKKWAKQIGGAFMDYGIAVAVDGIGNAYVTSYTLGSMDGDINYGSRDMTLVKYNSNGVKIWGRQMGGTGNDYPSAIALDSIGNAYVVGYTDGDLDDISNAGGYDFYLVKYDTNGTKVWLRMQGTTKIDVASGIVADGNGNTYITGSTYGDLNDTGNYNNPANKDIFLVKYNTDGVKQ